jgi:hypothetical protein
LLEEIGLGGERVAMFNLSAAMGARFAEIATEMTEIIRALGRNPCQRSGDLGIRDLGIRDSGSRESGGGEFH